MQALSSCHVSPSTYQSIMRCLFFQCSTFATRIDTHTHMHTHTHTHTHTCRCSSGPQAFMMCLLKAIELELVCSVFSLEFQNYCIVLLFLSFCSMQMLKHCVFHHHPQNKFHTQQAAIQISFLFYVFFYIVASTGI